MQRKLLFNGEVLKKLHVIAKDAQCVSLTEMIEYLNASGTVACTRETFYKWCGGAISVNKLIAICNELRIPIKHFFYLEGEEPNNHFEEIMQWRLVDYKNAFINSNYAPARNFANKSVKTFLNAIFVNKIFIGDCIIEKNIPFAENLDIGSKTIEYHRVLIDGFIRSREKDLKFIANQQEIIELLNCNIKDLEHSNWELICDNEKLRNELAGIKEQLKNYKLEQAIAARKKSELYKANEQLRKRIAKLLRKIRNLKYRKKN